jgi:regulator of sigma E protease
MIYVIGIIGLGLMVFIHELGHFVAAKLNGVVVEKFSLGWGPRLVGFTRKGTIYQISWLPIGGYCKMKGELVPGLAGGEAGKDTVPVPEKGSFLAAARWQRIVIYVFGPLFNLLFAVIVSALIALAGTSVVSTDNRIVLATDYSVAKYTTTPPATEAGLRTGDRITAIDGAPMPNFFEISKAIYRSPGRKLTFVVQRREGSAERSLTLKVTPQLDKESGAGRIGIYGWVDPVLDTVRAGSAAAIAGLRPGDRILSANGHPVAQSVDLEQALAEGPQRLTLDVDREGRRESIVVVPNFSGAAAADNQVAAALGITFAGNVYPIPPVGVGRALVEGVERTWSTAVDTVRGIGLLFRGVNIRNAVAGPVGITRIIGSVTASGFARGVGAGFEVLFTLLSILSVALFLMNLLPIPAMDGGQILLLVIEIVRGRPVRTSIAWRLQTIGFALMIALFLFATMNDIGIFGR